MSLGQWITECDPDVLLVQPAVLQPILRRDLPAVQAEYWDALGGLTKLYDESGSAPQPNIGLLYVASCLRESGFKVGVVDFHVLDSISRITQERIITETEVKSVLDQYEASVYGISCMTNSYDRALRIASYCKHANPNGFVMLGGIHPTFTDIAALKSSLDVDCVVRGEGEVTCVEVVDKVLKGKDLRDVKGITYRADCHIRRNENRPLIEDLDTIPYPAYDLLPLEAFPFIPRVYSARGCIGQCAFCTPNKLFDRRIRTRDSVKVVDEIETLSKSLRVKSFLFGDLTFMANPRHSVQVLEELVSRRLDVDFWCQTRADRVSFARALLLKKAGCKKVGVGVETGNQKIIGDPNVLAHKINSLEMAREACRNIKKAGVSVQTYWMFGLPGETYESAFDTIRAIDAFFVEDLTDLTHIAITVPYPGTSLYEDPEAYNIRIVTHDFSKYQMNADDLGCDLPVLETQALNRHEIYALWSMGLAVAAKHMRKKAENMSLGKKEANLPEVKGSGIPPPLSVRS
jgi:anaerobic magnesium-protoporphyrin IX monomethyl ester cyclase